MKRLGLLQILLAAAILLSACAKQTPEPVTYQVDLSEYAFTPNAIEAAVGQQVTLELTNKGLLEHEFMIGRDMMKMDSRPGGYQTDMFGMAHVEPQVMMAGTMGDMTAQAAPAGHSGFMVVLPKTGDQATVTFTVTKDMVGEWEIGCFSQEGVHYDAGMKGKFIVKQ